MAKGHEMRDRDLTYNRLLREEGGNTGEKVHSMGGAHDMKAERGPWGEQRQAGARGSRGTGESTETNYKLHMKIP